MYKDLLGFLRSAEKCAEVSNLGMLNRLIWTSAYPISSDFGFEV